MFLAVALPLAADDVPLFPTPLHLVRRVDDPISGRASEVDEYCAGNRIITVDRDGSRVVIVDYERQELLQIDRAASTYSVARFDEIAAANRLTEARASSAQQQEWKTTPAGMKASQAGRNADAFEIEGPAIRIDLKVDRQVSLSRRAFDALTGAAYPNRVTAQQEAIARASMRSAEFAAAKSVETYGIPLEQVMTFDDGGRPLTIRNVVVSLTNDLPPPELLAIPAGAKLVPSRAARILKSMKELKEPAPQP